VLLEVVLEADLQCPRCKALERHLRRICNELNIPFRVKYFVSRSVTWYEESVSTHTFSPEWIREHGLPEHKKVLEKISPILAFIQRGGVQLFPNTIIRWHDGYRVREIVIRGFDPGDEERARVFLANLYSLLRVLKRVVYH